MNKYSTIVLLAIAATAVYLLTPTQDSPNMEFGDWVNQFSHMVQIKPEEMIYRAKIFEKNVKEINEHNSIEGKTYKLGINQFTAYTQQEFEAMYLSHIEAPKTEVKSES